MDEHFYHAMRGGGFVVLVAPSRAPIGGLNRDLFRRNAVTLPPLLASIVGLKDISEWYLIQLKIVCVLPFRETKEFRLNRDFS